MEGVTGGIRWKGERLSSYSDVMLTGRGDRISCIDRVGDRRHCIDRVGDRM